MQARARQSRIEITTTKEKRKQNIEKDKTQYIHNSTHNVHTLPEF